MIWQVSCKKFGDGKQEFKAEDIGKMMAKFMRIFKLLPKFIAIRQARKGTPPLFSIY